MDGEVKKRSHAKKKPQEGRDERGQFTKGHKIAEEVRFQKENAAACKYREEYADELIEYFSAPTYAETVNEKTGIVETIPTRYPTFEEFASNHKVVMQTLYNWEQQSQRFGSAMKRARELQKMHLVQNTLCNRYNPQFAKFLASAEFGMSEKTTTDSNVSFTVTLPKEIDEESN